MSKPIIGHCAIIYPPTSNGPIPYIYGNGPLRKPGRNNHAMRYIACTDEEHRWICAQLAKRRAKSSTRQRRAGKAVRGHEAI